LICIRKYRLLFLLLLLIVPGNAFSGEEKSALVVEFESGKILYEKDADRLIQPASLTKIMALYLVNEDLRAGKIHLSDSVKISSAAVNTGGSSKMLSGESKEIRLEDLIKGMAVISANDATVAVAEHLAGNVNEFVERMNAKAGELGMSHSFFVNPHGLSDVRQLSTARDLSVLAREYIKRFPDMLDIHSLQYFRFDGVTRSNRNLLLKEYPGVDGLKTGYVRASGYHLIATAKRGDVRIIAIVLGAKTIRNCATRAKMLLEGGFHSCGNKKL